MIDLFDEYDESELLHINIKFLGLDQDVWELTRGARVERLYTDPADDSLRIRDSYTYTMTDGDRVATPSTRKIEWFKTDGTVGLEVTRNLKFSPKSLKGVQREIRQGRIDYLETAAENLRELALTLAEPEKTQYNTVADNIDNLFAHYEHDVLEYIQRGTMAFENAVNNETDATILAILAIPARAPDADFPNGLTVKQSIIYQLTGVKP